MEEQLVQRIKCHPAFERLGNLDLPGFTLPKGNFSRYNPDDTHDKRTLATFGIRVSGSLGGNSEVYVEPAMAGANLELRGIGLGGNVVVLSPKCRIKGSIVFEGTKHIFIAGGCPTSSNVAAVFRTEECGIFLGEETSFGGAAFWAEGPKVGIFVGDGSMVSWDVNLRTSDGHGIVDLLTMSKCNEHKSVIIRPHVWLGMGVTVCPGTEIGSGAIVGMHSVVTRSIDPCTLSIGIPARLHRSGVSWTRRAIPKSGDLDALSKLPAVASFLQANRDQAKPFEAGPS